MVAESLGDPTSELSSWLTQPWQVSWWPFRPPYSLKILPLVSYVYCLYFWFTHRFGCFRISYWSPTISLFCFISVLSGWRTLRNVYQLMGMLAWKLFDHSSVCFVWSTTKKIYSPNLHCSLTLPWIFAFCACHWPAKPAIQGWSTYLGPVQRQVRHGVSFKIFCLCYYKLILFRILSILNFFTTHLP